MENNELLHYGVLGMRWGIRKDAAQLTRSRKEKKQIKKDNRRVRRMTKEELAKEKQKIIDTGDVARARRHMQHFTTEELRKVMERHEVQRSLNKKLSEIDADKIKKGLDKTRQLGEFMTSTATITSQGITIWNNAAKTMNTFAETNIPTIKNQSPNDNKK